MSAYHLLDLLQVTVAERIKAINNTLQALKPYALKPCAFKGHEKGLKQDEKFTVSKLYSALYQPCIKARVFLDHLINTAVALNPVTFYLGHYLSVEVVND